MNALYKIFSSLFILAFLCSCGGSDGSDGTPGTGDYTVRYEVEGGSGVINEADITYINANGLEQTLTDTPIPWVYTFMAEPDADLSLTAILHGSGTSTLYAIITIDNTCWIDERTFITEQAVSVSGTPQGILTSCPNHSGTTVD